MGKITIYYTTGGAYNIVFTNTSALVAEPQVFDLFIEQSFENVNLFACLQKSK